MKVKVLALSPNMSDSQVQDLLWSETIAIPTVCFFTELLYFAPLDGDQGSVSQLLPVAQKQTFTYYVKTVMSTEIPL